MTEEIGLAQPVEYTEAERRTIATHEAGHATVAWLVGKGRKLEVLSIIKRKDALGLLAHSEDEERFTKTQTEIRALIQIAFGGMVAEELFFGETSTRAWPATSRPPPQTACQMVGQLGMGTTLISSAAMEYPAGGIVSKVLANDAGRDEVERCWPRPRTRSPGCSRTTATWSRPCATPSSSATSWSGTRSSM